MRVTNPESSPTAQARRRQIVSAAIDVLAEFGYAHTSFAKIAQRAGLSSTRLISYHFAGKEELMRAIAHEAKDIAVDFIEPRLHSATDAREMLATYISANIAFMRERFAALRALIELDKNARSAIGEPFLPDDSPLSALEAALRAGQAAGEFRDFDPHVAALALRAAIDTVSARYADDPSIDLDPYARQLVDLFDHAISAPSQPAAGDASGG